jgi:hypothetical protein
MSLAPAALVCKDAAAGAMPELVWANAIIDDVLTTNTLASAAIATSAAEGL